MEQGREASEAAFLLFSDGPIGCKRMQFHHLRLSFLGDKSTVSEAAFISRLH